MKIINSLKFAEEFRELYDWVDDDTVETLDKYNENDFDDIDYDALEDGDIPIIEVDDGNIDRVLFDNLEEPQAQEPIIEEPEVNPEEEIAIEGEDIPDFANTQEAMNWAIENNRVIKIFYTTKGRGGKNDKKYLKREKGLKRTPQGGVSIYRIVEPHYIFQAGNGNLIMVTYDRSVGRGAIGRGSSENIRAYIVDNISDYNFVQNRKTKKPQVFKPKFKVMPKSNKRIDTMENINDSLKEIEVAFQSKGLVKAAAIVRIAEENFNNIKTAQYVGVQGYWIRNRRCWDNCYRQKRTTQPETPAQEVWMECWDEYKKSINNNESGWEKYAEKDGDVKTSSKDEIKWNKLFISKVANRIKKDTSIPEAIYATIEEESQVQIDKMLESSSQLMEIADTLHESGQEDLGEKLASISTKMLKESGFFGLTDVEKEAQFQGGNSKWGPLSRGWNKVKNLWTGKGGKEDVVKKLQDVIERANRMLTQTIMSYKPASPNVRNLEAGKSIIIEAGKGIKFITAKPLKTKEEVSYDNATQIQEQNKKDRVLDEKAQDEVYQAEQRGLSQQGTYQDKDSDGVVDSVDVDDNANNILDVQEKPQSINIGQEYTNFYNDVTQLVTQLGGYATGQDQEAKNYASQASPLLQNFLNRGLEQKQMKDSVSSVDFLQESLKSLIKGLQGVLSGQLLGEAGLGGAGLGGTQTNQTIPFNQNVPKARMVDIDKLVDLDDPTLNEIGQNVKRILDERSLVAKKPASTKLKFVK